MSITSAIGLWILPVLWKTRAIRSASTAAFQEARFPQHLGAADGAHRLHRHFRRTLDQDKIGSRRPVT